MSRGQGKRTTHRQENLIPGQAAEYGLEPERDIPGGETHLINKQVLRQQVPTAEPLAAARGMMAHGVPPHEFTDRKHPGRQEAPRVPQYAELPKNRPAIPVVIVDQGAGAAPLRVTVTKHFQAPPIGAEPVLVCGEDVRRHAIYLLNEGASDAAGIRFGALSDLALDVENEVLVGGGMLPNAMTSYQKFEGQSALYVVSMDSHTPYVSVVTETSNPTT
ncbi:MAG TPA: hypothetical protein VGG75_42660 [Trebonia sp.]|jgi:hypothetical protein